MNKKTLEDVQLEGKKVLWRVDLNVPMQDGEVTDDTRIRAVVPTIQYLVEHGAKVILASHLGRPKGEVVEELRLDPVAKKLGEILHKEVQKVDEVYGENVNGTIATLQNGEILLLENVRFEKGEEANEDYLIDAFANMADIYVNDAFGTSHRAHASTSGVAGILMEKEIAVLSKALEETERQYTAIIGGSKVKDKINVIDNFLDIVDHLIIGGGLACTFLKAKGFEIGNSLLEEDKLELA